MVKLYKLYDNIDGGVALRNQWKLISNSKSRRPWSFYQIVRLKNLWNRLKNGKIWRGQPSVIILRVLWYSEIRRE